MPAAVTVPPSGCQRHRIAPDSILSCPFRLFRIDGRDWDGLLKITLVEGDKSHNVREYKAISYAWQGQHQDVPIKCNGHVIRITNSLHEFFMTLKMLQTSLHPEQRSWYWADQICISKNQFNDKERQIPIMDTYFSQAKEVLIWLGQSDDMADLTLDMVEDVSARLADIEAVRRLWRLGHLPNGVPDHRHIFWRGLGEILVRPWFSRLWTVQEVLLAKSTVFYCGSSAANLSPLLDRLFQAGMMLLVEAPGLHPDERSNFSRMLYGLHYFQTEIPAWVLVDIAGRRQCEHKIDKVYAMLGLVRPEEKQLVKVKYSSEESNGHIETWIHWAHLALQGTGLILLLGVRLPRIPHLPSWCPNLDSPSLADLVGKLHKAYEHYGGFDAGVNVPFPYAVTADKRGLICYGWLADRVKETLEQPDAEDLEAQLQLCWDQISREWPDFREQMKNSTTPLVWFLSRCWALGQETAAGDPEDKWVTFLRTITANQSINPESHLDLDIPEESNALKQMWIELEEDNLRGLLEHPIKGRIRRACVGRNFFITEGGMMGLGPMDVQAGDLVCMFRAFSTPFILRELAAEDHVDLIELDPKKSNLGCILVGNACIPDIPSEEQAAEALRHTRGVKEQFFTMY